MGTYYYLKDPETKDGMIPIYEDDYITAIFKIAKDKGVIITDRMIAEEVNKRCISPSPKKKSPNRKPKTVSTK